jgi:aryl-alcohol dehydrogenase-like predicted oxidoreductase
MKTRTFAPTLELKGAGRAALTDDDRSFEPTEIGLGCWQLGGGWGKPWNDATAQAILESAYASGVRFLDTADVYGDGESERSIGRFLRTHSDVRVATKLGRWGIYPDGYTRESVRAATRNSLERLGVDRLELTQLHCIPLSVLREGEIFDWLRELRDEGLITRFGASVETVEEGLVAMQQPDLSSLQIIFNIFRQKPLEELLPRAQAQGVGIIVRLPLASGLLTGKLTKETHFVAGDHRNFNRDGEKFNVGETFAGLEYDAGLAIVEELKTLLPEGMTMAQMALRWILDQAAVTTVIPGASSLEQAHANASAAALPPLSPELHATLARLYANRINALIRGPY